MGRLSPRAWYWLLLACAVAAFAVAAWFSYAELPPAADSTDTLAPATPSPPIVPRPRPTGPLDWIAIGGGPWPDGNEVQIEQDLDLAAQTFRGRGVLLFAGGRGRDGVQVLNPTPRGDPLLRELAELLAPRPGRDARYRPSTIDADGSARIDTLETALVEAANASDDLLLFLAGHGEPGAESKSDASMLLWTGERLTVEVLATLLEDTVGDRRRVRVIVTSCFSGAFAELAWAGADPTAGAAPTRCGLFAATAEEPSSGCDPNPERRMQRGYALLFLNALRRLAPDGSPLPPNLIDLDGDGAISLLDAHTRVRIATNSIDIPTTTSERWLRRRAPRRGPRRAVDLPHEAAAVAALIERTGLTAASARQRLSELRERMTSLSDELDELRDTEDAEWAELTGALLSRWPVLDDPWHPDFDETLERNRIPIQDLLAGPTVEQLREARAQSNRVGTTLEQLRLDKAPVERLVRALESIELAERLRARGGRDWKVYQQLLACESSLPP